MLDIRHISTFVLHVFFVCCDLLVLLLPCAATTLYDGKANPMEFCAPSHPYVCVHERPHLVLQCFDALIAIRVSSQPTLFFLEAPFSLGTWWVLDTRCAHRCKSCAMQPAFTCFDDDGVLEGGGVRGRSAGQRIGFSKNMHYTEGHTLSHAAVAHSP